MLLLWPCICCSDSQKSDRNDLVSLAVVWNYSLFLLFAIPYETWGQCEYVESYSIRNALYLPLSY